MRIAAEVMPGNTAKQLIRTLFMRQPLRWLNARGSFLCRLDLDLADAACGVCGGALIANRRILGGRFGLFDANLTQCGTIVGTRFSGQKEACALGERSALRAILRTTFENLTLTEK